jgi:regulation of enolase protein 1 (concanavalin A-like superfamily)
VDFILGYSFKQMICKFSLEQQMINPKTLESYEPVLNQICLFLNVKLATRKRLNYKNSYYIVRIENQNSIKLLIDYLNKYPLLSSKYLDYLDWANSFDIILKKEHMTVQGKEKIL